MESAYKKADSLSKNGNDSAFFYYNLVANNSKDRIEKARAYNRMSFIQLNAGDLIGSQETIMESQKLLDENIQDDYPYLFSNYNLLGRSYLELNNFEAAASSFRKALEFQEKGKSNPILLNNLAVSYQKLKEYDKAKSLFQSAIDSNRHDTLTYARALSNLARTKWLENPAYNAIPELLKALNLREFKNDQSGLNASYSHLSDYYRELMPDSSLYYAKKMYQVAKSPDDILEAIEKISKAATTNEIKYYSGIYFKLNDSLKQARNAAKNQFAPIRFETEKNKADNLRLQRDNFKQRVFLYSTIVSFLILSGLGLAWYRRRKQKLEVKSQEQIREYQLQTSKKVHDVVANGLYRIMNELEHRETIDKAPLLDKIEVLYEKSRDISYDKPEQESSNYTSLIQNLLMAFETANIKISVSGNKEGIWKRFSSNEKSEIEYVLQEFMVNMSKHSQAKKVEVSFSEEYDSINLQYQDDGIGFLPDFEFGNGLKNAENRINKLGGSIIFDGTNGLKIQILLPKG